MIYPKTEIILKSGQKAYLRSPGTDDAEQMLCCLRTVCAETEFLMRIPEECDEITLEKEASFLEGKALSENEYMIACEVDGEIVGSCGIMFMRHFKTAHRAGVNIAIKEKCWSLGIGSAMFETLIGLARERGVGQIELDFVEGNSRARGLYEKFGFRICGIIPDAIKQKDGRLVNEYHMIKKL